MEILVATVTAMGNILSAIAANPAVLGVIAIGIIAAKAKRYR